MNRTITFFPRAMRFNPGRKSRLQLLMASRILRLFPGVVTEAHLNCGS